MLLSGDKLRDVPILSIQAGGMIARTGDPIIDPNDLKIVGFKTTGPLSKSETNILDVRSIREFSNYGMVIDSEEEFVSGDDVIKIKQVLDLGFNLIGLKVESRRGSKLGKVSSFTCTEEDFTLQQLIVQRPAIKSFMDPELLIPRSEIVEVNDYKVIVRDEEKKIKERAAKEDFIPNFVNPFRKNPKPDYAPSQTETPDEADN